MLITDFRKIGNNLYKIRKNRGLTQTEVAEKAELSDRTYADIERGSVNMRIETLIKICNALNITPNDILVIREHETLTEEQFTKAISTCSEQQRQTAMAMLNIYLKSLNN